MSLDTASGVAVVALACTFVTFVAIRLWQFATIPFARTSSFPNSIMLDAGQRFRDELDRLKGEQGFCLILTLVFSVTAGMAAVLGPQRVIGNQSLWIQIAVIAVVGIVLAAQFYRLATIYFRKRRIAFVRDANVAIGHSLQALTDNRNRVFHDVVCATGVIDNVVVGMQGIYAVFVVARRPAKDNRVSLQQSELQFAGATTSLPLADFAVGAKQLAKKIQNAVGHTVRVKPVIAVPGWEIEAQASEIFLLVNERNLSMIRGWRDENDYLMDDEVATIQMLMRKACMRSGEKTK